MSYTTSTATTLHFDKLSTGDRLRPGLGSTAITVNGEGTAEVGELRYYAYGETRYSSGSTPTSYRFTGQREDSYIKLIHMGARWYDAQIGRFVSADTIIPDPSNPQSLNRFAYVLNNPLRFIDPSGHKPCDSVDAAGRCIPAIQVPGFWIQFSGDWSTTLRYVVQNGVEAIGRATAAVLNEGIHQDNLAARKSGEPTRERVTAEQAFRRVYGQVAFVVAPQCTDANPHDCVDAGAWAWSRIGALGEVWVSENALTDPDYAGRAGTLNTVHEFGHGIDQLGGNVASGDLAAAWNTEHDLTRTAGGFSGPFPWQQSTPDTANTASEVFADMFLGWTYNQWQANPRALDYGAGMVKAQYMRANMPGVIALAVSGN
jgi:RHS repeat-associated protein